MIRVGITGNIGSGKSSCCKILELLGAPVFYADIEAKNIMINDQGVKAKLQALLGQDAYLANGHLNRPYIGDKIFNNKRLLSKLNLVVHPRVHEYAEQWFEQKSKYHKLLFYENALIVENNAQSNFDHLILVSAPKEIRIQRVMARDGLNREQVEAKINNQLDEESKRQVSDYEIKNDGKTSIVKETIKIYNLLLEVAAQ